MDLGRMKLEMDKAHSHFIHDKLSALPKGEYYGLHRKNY